jgi:hypothetical protein
VDKKQHERQIRIYYLSNYAYVASSRRRKIGKKSLSEIFYLSPPAAAVAAIYNNRV